MGAYFDALCGTMHALGAYPNSIFLGQAIANPGTGMSASFKDVPRDKLVELPVFEDCQLGMSIGLSLAGQLPISVFPRWNFLVCAANQLVNHLDKIQLYSAFTPRVIIRVAVGTDQPLNPGPQHLGDFTWGFRSILKTVRIVQLEHASEIPGAYYEAALHGGSTILVEYPEMY
jgi:pyruvate/2-oxoglutarate/acetoin dehydrogenase E1 component